MACCLACPLNPLLDTHEGDRGELTVVRGTSNHHNRGLAARMRGKFIHIGDLYAVVVCSYGARFYRFPDA